MTQLKLECRVHYWQVATDGRSQRCINCGKIETGLWEKEDKIEGCGGRSLQKGVNMDSFRFANLKKKQEIRLRKPGEYNYKGMGNCPVLELSGIFYMDATEVKTCLACTVEKCYYDLDKGEMKLMREQVESINSL